MIQSNITHQTWRSKRNAERNTPPRYVCTYSCRFKNRCIYLYILYFVHTTHQCPYTSVTQTTATHLIIGICDLEQPLNLGSTNSAISFVFV